MEDQPSVPLAAGPWQRSRFNSLLTGGEKRGKITPAGRKEWFAMKHQTISMNSAFAFTYYYFMTSKGIG